MAKFRLIVVAIIALGALTLQADAQGRHVIPSSTQANLPAAGTAGAVARVTNNVRGVWMDQGSQWFATNGRVVNVQEFGAVAGGPDNQSAFNTALAAGAGGTVLIPAGTYSHSGTLDIPDDTIVMGAGRNATILSYTGSGSHVTITASSARVDVVLRDLRLTSSTAANGIVVTSARDVLLQNLTIYGNQAGYTNACVRLTGDGTANGGAQTVTIQDVDCINPGAAATPGNAIEIAAQGANALKVIGGNASGVNRAFWVSHGTGTNLGITIVGYTAATHANSTAPMFDVQGVSGFQVFGGYFENSTAQNLATFKTGAGITGIGWFGSYIAQTGGATVVFEFQTGADVTIDGSHAISAATTTLVLATTAGALQNFWIAAGMNITNSFRDGAAGTAYTEKLVMSGALRVVSQTVDAIGLRTPATTAASILANQNDYAPSTTAGFLRLSSDAAYNITGMTGGLDGRRITVANFGAFTLTFTNADVASASANRFLTNTGANIALAAAEILELIYDSSNGRWRAWKP